MEIFTKLTFVKSLRKIYRHPNGWCEQTYKTYYHIEQYRVNLPVHDTIVVQSDDKLLHIRLVLDDLEQRRHKQMCGARLANHTSSDVRSLVLAVYLTEALRKFLSENIEGDISWKEVSWILASNLLFRHCTPTLSNG